MVGSGRDISMDEFDRERGLEERKGGRNPKPRYPVPPPPYLQESIPGGKTPASCHSKRLHGGALAGPCWVCPRLPDG